MKTLVQNIAQFRNPQFVFAQELSSSMFLDFFFHTAFSLIRGLKTLLIFKNPKGASLGKGVRFQYSSRLSFGKFLKVGDQVRFSALGKKGIQLGNNVSIGSYSSLIVSTTLGNLGEKIQLGNNVGMGEFAYLGGAGGLEIGDNCIIGQYFSCHPENHNFSNLTEEIRWQGTTRKGIKIGENCWIGSKVTVLDGVEIGSGCVIAAGAVVTQSFPKNSILAGVPAKIIKSR